MDILYTSIMVALFPVCWLLASDIHVMDAQFVHVTAQTGMGGVIIDHREIRKGATDAVEHYVRQRGAMFPPDVLAIVDDTAKKGATRLSSPKDLRSGRPDRSLYRDQADRRNRHRAACPFMKEVL